MSSSSRRKFLQQLSSTGLALTAATLPAFAAEPAIREYILSNPGKISPNDRLRIATIGMGIMGYNDTDTALKVPGIELVAACDLYTGRLQRAKEKYGSHVFATRDYREILERKDIDAVIVGTGDHWHSRIAIDAMNKGKHVYCEKPMVRQISEGAAVIAAQQKTDKVMQVGSQGISGLEYLKARELYQAGEIGKLNCIEASYDRHSALGAWEYTMPTDGSAQTVDWDRYIAGMPKEPYDARKFFWWRNYKEFGTGVAGDLFVHLLTAVHMITGSKGPEKIYATGEISYWKDGRNVPDIMTAIMDYPETKEHPAFKLTLRVNFSSGMGERSVIRFIGDEGVMETGDGVKITHDLLAKAPGIGGWDALTTYPKAMQETLVKQYNEKYSKAEQEQPQKPAVIYKAPEGHDEHVAHFTNFFDAIRTNGKVLEDAVFGFRAAAPCLACNDSYFSKKIIEWDPVNMKLV
ncbi:MAG TPA: Gfo/Idh/MocA family oxidoreductase [Agriterribacter sp.]|nr:Gfo/Idh/MocA family oxidoreductase [Agriterribacter sp.]